MLLSYACLGWWHYTPPTNHRTLCPCLSGVGRLILDILHALSQGHGATGHEVQGAVSPSLLLLVRMGEGGRLVMGQVLACC